MPKRVEGFLTSDGRYFDSKEEAEYQEARHTLAAEFDEAQLSVDEMFRVLDTYEVPIARYLIARIAHVPVAIPRVEDVSDPLQALKRLAQ